MENNYQQQTNPGIPPHEPPPDNNLVWAILSTVLCCLPLGIVAIIKSSNVNNKWQMGDREGARKDAADAKKFALWGAIAGVVVAILYVLFVVVMGIGSGMMSSFSSY